MSLRGKGKNVRNCKTKRHTVAMEEHDNIKRYKDFQSGKAENMVFKDFPKIITTLNDILQNSQIFTKEYSDLHQNLDITHPAVVVSVPPQLKRTIFSNDPSHEVAETISDFPAIPTNRYITELVDILKPHVRKLLWDTNLLKMWISVMIPKVEDGNVIGVVVQLSTLEEIATVETKAMKFLQEVPTYFETRGNYIAKIFKYPYIEDYRKVVEDLDCQQYQGLLVMFQGIHDSYCFLHDVVTKNLSKIKFPRSNEAAQLLY